MASMALRSGGSGTRGSSRVGCGQNIGASLSSAQAGWRATCSALTTGRANVQVASGPGPATAPVSAELSPGTGGRPPR
jgi:hypothetical protein